MTIERIWKRIEALERTEDHDLYVMTEGEDGNIEPRRVKDIIDPEGNLRSGVVSFGNVVEGRSLQDLRLMLLAQRKLAEKECQI